MATEPLRPAAPGITIAITNWNHELLLPRAVDSALAGVRALADWEIAAEVLVVDDRSRDGSATLLRQLEALYYRQGLRLHLSTERHGVGAKRNVALRLATYRYIIYLDGDNELAPDVLPLFYRAMIDTRAALVYGNLLAHRPDGDILISNESVQGRLFHTPYIDMCALWDRLQFDDVGGMEEDQAIPEDLEMILHLVASGRRLVFVPVIFGHHYHYPGSWTSTIAQENPAYQPYLQRVFDQLGRREQNETNSQLLRYHPDLGYL